MNDELVARPGRLSRPSYMIFRSEAETMTTKDLHNLIRGHGRWMQRLDPARDNYLERNRINSVYNVFCHRVGRYPNGNKVPEIKRRYMMPLVDVS